MVGTAGVTPKNYKVYHQLASNVKAIISHQCRKCGENFRDPDYNWPNPRIDELLKQHAQYPICFWKCKACFKSVCIRHVVIRLSVSEGFYGKCPSEQPHADYKPFLLFSMKRLCWYKYYCARPDDIYYRNRLFIPFIVWYIWRWWRMRRYWIAIKRVRAVHDAINPKSQILLNIPLGVIKNIICSEYDSTYALTRAEDGKCHQTFWSWDGNKTSAYNRVATDTLLVDQAVEEVKDEEASEITTSSSSSPVSSSSSSSMESRYISDVSGSFVTVSGL